MENKTSRSGPPAPTECLRLEGHLTAAAMAATLDGVAKRLVVAPRPAVLVIDLLKMESYEPACRTAFAGWYRNHSHLIRAVAGVTNRASWRIIISTVGLATKGHFKSFELFEDAVRWAESLSSA